jgi:hypothetical protein
MRAAQVDRRRLRAMRNPNPIVTAEVPSGTMSPRSTIGRAREPGSLASGCGKPADHHRHHRRGSSEHKRVAHRSHGATASTVVGGAEQRAIVPSPYRARCERPLDEHQQSEAASSSAIDHREVARRNQRSPAGHGARSPRGSDQALARSPGAAGARRPPVPRRRRPAAAARAPTPAAGRAAGWSHGGSRPRWSHGRGRRGSGHDAERREREQEHDGAADAIAGRSSGSVTSRNARHREAPKHPRSVLESRVEVRPQAADRADDDGVVEEDMGDQDRVTVRRRSNVGALARTGARGAR